VSTAVEEAVATAPERKEDPEALVLRGRPRPTVRFRRGLVVAMTGAAAASLIGLSWLALEPAGFHRAVAPPAKDGPASGPPGDALADLPSNYGDVPRLGPPLPGDLGKPILEHERSLAGPEVQSAGADMQAGRAQVIDEQRQRAAALKQAARSSPLLARLEGGSAYATGETSHLGVAQVGAPSGSAGIGDRDDADAAANNPVAREPMREAPSPWTLSAGTVIPASLITGLNSDLSGIVIAQVTENVRDSATGRTILVPQGARLIGSYDSAKSYGQRRALLVWTRIVFPDGSSVGLDKVPASDAAGYSGVTDRVNSHGWQLLKGIALSTLLGVGTELSLGSSESDLARAVRESTQQNAADSGQQLVGRSLDVRPTITVRPGWPVRAILASDLVLRPWSGS